MRTIKTSKIIRDLDSFPNEFGGAALSIGKFDGVHRGHVAILERLIMTARLRNIPSVVFTFDPPPGEVIRPHFAPPLLCTLGRRLELIAQFEPDLIVVFPTTESFLRLSAEQFYRSIIAGTIDARIIVEGTDFNFGANRQGNIPLLQELAEHDHREVLVVAPVKAIGRDISSSRIRSLVRNGQVDVALGMLGQPYRITGFVAHGDHRGRKLGFPTANISGVTTIIPKPGLYAALAQFDQLEWMTAVHIGGNPTFGIETIKIEAHLLDFSGDLYGRHLHLDFLSRIRDIVSFTSSNELQNQIGRDLEQTRKLCQAHFDEKNLSR